MAFKNPFNSFKSSVVSPQEKKQRLLLVILAIVLVCIALVFYFGFLREDKSANQPASPVENLNKSDKQSSFQETSEMIDFDSSFFRDPAFKELKTYGQWPIKIENKGKSNPFGN